MKNKHITYIFKSLVLLGLFLTYSCSDYLDQNPDNRIKLDTEVKIKKSLTSAYPKASYWALTEMASDNADEDGTGKYSPYNLIQEQSYKWMDVIGEDNDTPYSIWSQFYASIQTACAALDALETLEAEGKITNRTEAAAIESEARLCRAYGHFILVNLFSKTYGSTSNTDLGIPYVLKPEKHLIVTYERGTVEGVYKKIEEDLTVALKNVGDINQNITKYHWNKTAAYAFAARFYLYYQKYDKAIEYANLALGDNPSTKLRPWLADGMLISSNNPDPAFNRYVSANQECNFLLVPAESLWGRISGPYSIGLGMTLKDITTKEIAPDGNLPVGGKVKYRYITYLSGGKVVCIKFKEYFEYFDKVAGIGWTHIVQPLFTADETLLTRAEAYTLSNQLDKAVTDLDMFTKNFTYYNNPISSSKETLLKFSREQTAYDPSSFDKPSGKKTINRADLSEDQKDIINPILQARRCLTIHEGLRWFDINRYNIEIYRRKIFNGAILVTDRLKVDDPRRAFQIPQQMVAAGIEPNPR